MITLTIRDRKQIVAIIKKIDLEVDDKEMEDELDLFITWAVRPIIEREMERERAALRNDIDRIKKLSEKVIQQLKMI